MPRWVFLAAILHFSAMASSQSVPSLIQQFQADEGSLTRLYTIDISKARRDRLGALYGDWLKKVDSLAYEKLSFDEKVDATLFKNHLRREIRQLDIERKRDQELDPLLPFSQTVIQLEESRRRFESQKPEDLAATLDSLAKAVKAEDSGLDKKTGVSKSVANRASGVARRLRDTLRNWFNYHAGYDPMFTWWVEAPYKAADEALKQYGDNLRLKLAGLRPDDTTAIVGMPVGRESLLADLQYEMIPYTPEQLIEIANREFAWCEREMLRASKDLGFGSDWRKALESVKNLHVEPGKQPELIRELALEAIDFLKAKDLVTIPALAEETWRMEMMSPERQLVNPFFLGGETIIVSFPTNTMSHDAKRMSMRGNNKHFSRATVQHELIPGHHLQQFMNSRYRTYRRPFNTPFWTEGWALYWEMLLWDLGFPKTAEDRVGMLFWRMHRCARIIFSLKFHLGEMTPEECIKFLVDRVGHEPSTAEGEVRRSFNGDYPPLYQLAYMIGGLQFRALHGELVGKGKMTNRQFHDAVLMENNIPVEMVRAILTKEAPGQEFVSKWRFAD